MSTASSQVNNTMPYGIKKRKQMVEGSSSSSTPLTKQFKINPQQNNRLYNDMQTPLSTHNGYAELSDNEEDIADQVNNTVKKVKIPPIVTINMTHIEINAVMSRAGIIAEMFHMKYMSIGIKIMLNSIENFQKAKKCLEDEKKHFFTHDIASDKCTKFVLSGLPDLDLTYVKNELHEANITCLDVQKMRLKTSRYEKQALYIVYFANNTMTLKQLKEHAYVLNLSVYWRPYISARSGPTQCNNCQQYGHGQKNCYFPPRCYKCGGKHLSDDCTLCNMEEDNFVPRCCLCGANHESKDKYCPKRIEFIQNRINSSNKNTRTSRPSPTNQFLNKSFTLAQPETNIGRNAPSYPPLRPVNENQQFASWFRHSSQTLPAPTQFDQNNQQQPRPLASSNQHHTQQSEFRKENLFSPEELIGITKSLILALRQCKTRMDQFEAVATVALKFGMQNSP